MAEKIYGELIQRGGLIQRDDTSETIELPDVTIVPSTTEMGKLSLERKNQILFPEAAKDFEAAAALSSVLEGMQKKALRFQGYTPKLAEFEEFGIQQRAEEVVQRILTNYVEVCREMDRNNKRFGPGMQYVFRGFNRNEGVLVTYGNYGLFAATLLYAAKDPQFKQYLIDKGNELLNDGSAFFHNPVATNAVVECKDGYLFARRGQTAEYANMLHQIAAGHHPPQEGANEIGLDTLVRTQVATEVAAPQDSVQKIRFLGLALSTGSKIVSTEKADLLTSAYIDETAEAIWERMKTASHKWETQALYVVPRDEIEHFIKVTSERMEQGAVPRGVKIFGEEVPFGTDPNSTSFWVPAGLAGLKTYLNAIEDPLELQIFS